MTRTVRPGAGPRHPRSALEVGLRLTVHNRNSVACLLSVLETELPPPAVVTRTARTAEQLARVDVAVYSFMTPQAAAVGREVGALRRRAAPPWLVAGGPHPSGDPSGTVAMGFDAVFVGEAGPAFGRYVAELAARRHAPRGIVQLSDRPSLDAYSPWPRSGELFAQPEITRGCPVGCAFCQTARLFGCRPRHRSLDSLLRALTRSRAAGHRFTRFVSPNGFGYGSSDPRAPNVPAIEALLMTARRAGMDRIYLGAFPSEVRPESVTADVLAVVQQHCDNDSISVGVQSGSDGMLERLGRGHSVDEAVTAVSRIASVGLTPRVDFIFGLPGETAEDQRLTRELVAHLAATYGAKLHGHLFEPLPGTRLARAHPTAVAPATWELVEQLRGRGLATGACRARRPRAPSRGEPGRRPATAGCPEDAQP